VRQLDELVPVITHRHWSLFQRNELLLLELHQTLRYVVLPEFVLNSCLVIVLGVSWATV
jgi:hypothetical protein